MGVASSSASGPRLSGRGLFVAAAAGAALACALPAHALIFNLGNSPTRQLHLQVGTGGTGAQVMPVNPTVDVVSVTVPAVALGNSASQVMSTSNPNTIDPYPPVALTCSDGRQVLVSAIARVPFGIANATLTVNSSAPLTNATGEVLPFSQISWTSSDGSIPSGAFNTGAAQTLLNMTTSRQYESCHTFSYANTGVVAAGTYRGRVTYTLSMP
jgi:hypothetical protein